MEAYSVCKDILAKSVLDQLQGYWQEHYKDEIKAGALYSCRRGRKLIAVNFASI